MGNISKQNTRLFSIWIVVVLSFLVLVSCASSKISSVATPSQVPSETKTPFATLQSTSTSTPPIPTETSSPTLKFPITVYESTSPDARWTAITSRAIVAGEERSIFKVVNDDGRIEWEVENEPFIDEPSIGFWFPVPLHWSKNGRYLYYAHRASGDGCFGGNKHLGKDLKRLDLATGEVSQVSNGGTYLSFSPDEKYLATISFGSEGINIQDLTNGKVNILALLIRHEDLGLETDQRYITWSPDSKTLVFVIMAGVCDFTVESYFNWIVRVDMDSLSQTMLTEKDERGLVPVSWTEQDKILTRDKDGNLWWMNPNTGAIASVR